MTVTADGLPPSGLTPDGDPAGQLSFDIVPPDPAALSESLRAFGYSPQTAIADIVDNSITAKARDIRVHFHWAGGASWVAIRDNGEGMSAEELVRAMRPGSVHPSSPRQRRDLGRFGLGLKTASFSQCRRLTVCSRRGNMPMATRTWDLDEISASGEWKLLWGASPEATAILEGLEPSPHGTIVLWHGVDRLVESDADPEDDRAQQRFLGIVGEVAFHLRMVFHRFIATGVAIHVNGGRLLAWDPFLSNHPATQVTPAQSLRLADHTVELRGYVLPHHSKLSSEEHGEAAGARGWNDHQGFYVYREARLLVPGSWLGLFKSEEHHKLARIAIDIPNSMDGVWAIDVRKSRATPPGPLRDALRSYARLVRERAVEVYRFRGKVLARTASENHVFAWDRVAHRGRIGYRVRRNHPLVAATLRSPTRERVAALIHLIEETLPVAAIQIDGSEHPDAQAAPFETTPSDTLRAVMVEVYRALRPSHDPNETRRLMSSMEAFTQHPELIATLDDSALAGTGG